MDVTLYGYGVVGRAHAEAMRSLGHNVAVVDPKLGRDEAKHSVAVIAVPTDGSAGKLDTTLLTEVSKRAAEHASLLVIRSTLNIGDTAEIEQACGMATIYVPEFLTERRAFDDALNPSRVLVGLTEKSADWAETAECLCPGAAYKRRMPARAAELVKLASNAFYALKVSYANELHDLAATQGIDYELVRSALAAEPMCGAEHWDVWFGGYRGFGGKCLPKDTAALNAAGQLDTLTAALAVNRRLRG